MSDRSIPSSDPLQEKANNLYPPEVTLFIYNVADDHGTKQKNYHPNVKEQWNCEADI